MPYLTPDTPPAGTICRTITIPDDPEWLAIVNGALLELTRTRNFEKFGTYTPEQTAAYFFDMWGDFHDSECMVIPIGMISMFGGIVPAKWLACNGQLVEQADYPELYAIISSTYGLSGTKFRVPNFDDRFPQGAHGIVIPGITGGEATHILTTPEMPSHTHTALRASGTVGGSTPRFSIAINTNTAPNGTTEATGGGGAHNNLPPYLYVNFGIYAGR